MTRSQGTRRTADVVQQRPLPFQQPPDFAVPLDRRHFLATAGVIAVGSAVGLPGCRTEQRESRPRRQRRAEPGTDTWEGIRAHFQLDPEYVHMAGLLLASHPTPVRNAIEEYRRELQADPAGYVQSNDNRLKSRVRQSAAEYMAVGTDEIALTDSTTMGTGLAITGLQIREDQEMLTTEFDYYSTHEAISYLAERTGASWREIPIYANVRSASEEEIVSAYLSEIRPNTRLVTATWVHSATGLKVPLRRIADGLNEINAGRAPGDRIIFFVDGVHGFGVEDDNIGDLGCDLFAAGTHKWLHGPRGTGILWGRPSAHNDVRPTIPTFTRSGGWGGRMSPGGFKTFEHEWAMGEAFDFHREISKERIRERIHTLARRLKEGLEEMDHVTLYTPMDETLSSGIVCFEITGMNPRGVVRSLRRHGVIASDTPYSPSHARLSPGIFNTDDEIEETLRAVTEL